MAATRRAVDEQLREGALPQILPQLTLDGLRRGGMHMPHATCHMHMPHATCSVRSLGEPAGDCCMHTPPHTCSRSLETVSPAAASARSTTLKLMLVRSRSAMNKISARRGPPIVKNGLARSASRAETGPARSSRAGISANSQAAAQDMATATCMHVACDGGASVVV